MKITEWNPLQMELFEAYGIDKNINLLVRIAKDIHYLRDLELYNDDTDLLKKIIEQSIINHSVEIINNYKDISKLEMIYLEIAKKSAGRLTIDNLTNHLSYKLDLYRQCKTEKLKETVCKITNCL